MELIEQLKDLTEQLKINDDALIDQIKADPVMYREADQILGEFQSLILSFRRKLYPENYASEDQINKALSRCTFGRDDGDLIIGWIPDNLDDKE